MNFKTEYVVSKLFITTIIVCLLPAFAAFGQQLKKETLKGSASEYAVFYSAGMPESAIWPLGIKLSQNGATIRHTPAKGNGDNISVNDKVPFRFIIAPAEEAGNGRYWAAVMGFHTGTGGDNANLNAAGSQSLLVGCRAYSTAEFPAGSWRMPTQREMMIIWLFREGINAIYNTAQLSGQYWTATEDAQNANQAWYMDFISTTPQSSVATKATAYKFRCVRDY